MKRQLEAATREDLLKILSDEEVVCVNQAKAGTLVANGDEFIDLTEIDRGVQRAGEAQSTKDVLPRKAVHENTWRKIVANLTARRLMTHVAAPALK